jgi:uncharacterized protein
MRKFLALLLWVLALAGVFVVLVWTFPKNKGMIPLFLILLVLDGYLWIHVRAWILSRKKAKRYLLLFLYWLAPGLLVMAFAIGIFLPFIAWDIPFRTYLTGIILILYGSKVFPLAFHLMADLFRLFQYGMSAFHHGSEVSYRYIRPNRILVCSGWGIGLLFLLVMSFGIAWGNYHFQVKKVNIDLAELPPVFDGLRIVQISDIHLGSWTCPGRLEKAVDMINDLKPDVIFFTGDLMNFCSRDTGDYRRILSGMMAPEGIYAILGNHDYGDYIRWRYPELKKLDKMRLVGYERSLGWNVLLNENHILVRGHDSIAIIGVENWGMAARFQRVADIPKAMKGVENLPVKLFLTHDPSHWDRVVSRDHKDVDVTFSGHTHGFQMGIECCGIKWSPAEYTYPEWAGLYSRPVPASHPQYIYINRGLGSIGWPGRIGEWPEITLIVLRRPAGK